MEGHSDDRSCWTAVTRTPRSGEYATLNLGYGQSAVSFTRSGFEEMDEVTHDGHTEFPDDGAIEIVFAYDNGDEAVLKAKPGTSSTVCSYVRLQAFSHNSFLSGFDDESICVELLNKAGDRAFRRRLAYSYARVGYRISVFSSGAASV